MSPFRRGYKRIAYLTGISLVFITLGIEYFQYQRNQNLILIDLKNRLDEHTSNVNLRARTLQGYVNGLKIAAENNLFYIKKFHIKSPLFSELKSNIETNSYDLGGVKNRMVGNLMGQGSVKDFSDSLKDEINMALSLNTNFEIALKNNRGIVWAYYTSKNHFQNLYPWIPPNPNPYNRLVEDKFFFKGATPFLNPNRVNFWTPAYQDGVGFDTPYHKEIVVTNSAPVYDGNEFLGSVSIDLSLSEMGRIMKRFDALQGSLLLINKDHQVLAINGLETTALTPGQIQKLESLVSGDIVHRIDQEIQTPSEYFSIDKSSLIYVRNLHDAPWYMVYIGSKNDLFMKTFFEAIEDIFIITFALIFVVGMAYFMVIRDFISPAQKLIDHISNENKGLESVPQNLPSRWRPWFDIVSRIFAENRALMENLENRVKLRTKQLEQTLHDLKKAQNQIIVQEKLASLGALTAGIAHEIKNPLHFIINFSELSLDYLQELKEKSSNENDLFSLIEQNIIKTREHAERADSIVKGMLAHARGSSGKITTFNLNKLLDEAIDLAHIGFQGKEIHFSAKIRKEFDQNIQDIHGFQQDLVRVFLNIVNNACFAMHQKQQKEGDFYQPELFVKTQDKGKTVKIIFEDNGPGMTQALIKKIFTPFFTTKDPGKGTGLGLSLSYDIITQQHHGHLFVESKAGRYSRFIIELPKVL